MDFAQLIDDHISTLSRKKDRDAMGRTVEKYRNSGLDDGAICARLNGETTEEDSGNTTTTNDADEALDSTAVAANDPVLPIVNSDAEPSDAIAEPSYQITANVEDVSPISTVTSITEDNTTPASSAAGFFLPPAPKTTLLDPPPPSNFVGWKPTNSTTMESQEVSTDIMDVLAEAIRIRNPPRITRSGKSANSSNAEDYIERSSTKKQGNSDAPMIPMVSKSKVSKKQLKVLNSKSKLAVKKQVKQRLREAEEDSTASNSPLQAQESLVGGKFVIPSENVSYPAVHNESLMAEEIETSSRQVIFPAANDGNSEGPQSSTTSDPMHEDSNSAPTEPNIFSNVGSESLDADMVTDPNIFNKVSSESLDADMALLREKVLATRGQPKIPIPMEDGEVMTSPESENADADIAQVNPSSVNWHYSPQKQNQPKPPMNPIWPSNQNSGWVQNQTHHGTGVSPWANQMVPQPYPMMYYMPPGYGTQSGHAHARQHQMPHFSYTGYPSYPQHFSQYSAHPYPPYMQGMPQAVYNPGMPNNNANEQMSMPNSGISHNNANQQIPTPQQASTPFAGVEISDLEWNNNRYQSAHAMQPSNANIFGQASCAAAHATNAQSVPNVVSPQYSEETLQKARVLLEIMRN